MQIISNIHTLLISNLRKIGHPGIIFERKASQKLPLFFAKA
jgi:hypothetical protein